MGIFSLRLLVYHTAPAMRTFTGMAHAIRGMHQSTPLIQLRNTRAQAEPN